MDVLAGVHTAAMTPPMYASMFPVLAMVRRGRSGGWIGGWSPGIGDATLGGWLTVFAYAVTAFMCWRVLSKRRTVSDPRERIIWRCLMWAVAALGINKQLDLQTALTEMGRIIARTGGWYGERRSVQALFILGIAAAGGALAYWLLRRARATEPSTRLALFGFLGLLLFVVIRAASFHHFDQLIFAELMGLRFNWVLENGTLGVIAFGAHQRVRILRTPPARSPAARGGTFSRGGAKGRKAPGRRP